MWKYFVRGRLEPATRKAVLQAERILLSGVCKDAWILLIAVFQSFDGASSDIAQRGRWTWVLRGSVIAAIGTGRSLYEAAYRRRDKLRSGLQRPSDGPSCRNATLEVEAPIASGTRSAA